MLGLKDSRLSSYSSYCCQACLMYLTGFFTNGPTHLYFSSDFSLWLSIEIQRQLWSFICRRSFSVSTSQPTLKYFGYQTFSSFKGFTLESFCTLHLLENLLKPKCNNSQYSNNIIEQRPIPAKPVIHKLSLFNQQIPLSCIGFDDY